MAEKISRRKFAALALGAAAAPVLARGQEEEKKADDNEFAMEIAGDMASIDKKLAKPLSAEARKLTQEALKNNRTYLKGREFALPENSEPCFVFHPRRTK